MLKIMEYENVPVPERLRIRRRKKKHHTKNLILQVSLPEDLDTNLEDHCLVGDTQITTRTGQRKIKDLVGSSGEVRSSDGKWHKYHDVRRTREKAKVFTVTLEDGTQFTGTEDHRILTEHEGWCPIGELQGKELRICR
ncbi:hypothetical protein ACTQW9_07615 [Lachnospiraceae bacterium LCP19S3_B12]